MTNTTIKNDKKIDVQQQNDILKNDLQNSNLNTVSVNFVPKLSNLNDLIAQQKTTNTISNFTNFVSKQSLLQSNILSVQCAQFITNLKNCFCFSLYNVNNNFLVITMYYNSTKKYDFYLLNCTNFNTLNFDSVKQCKNYVVNVLVNDSIKNDVIKNDFLKTVTK